jgi:phosphate starvation-inducible PhoH-like protein
MRKKKKVATIYKKSVSRTELSLKQHFISAKNEEQKEYLKKIKDNDMIFCYGRAGTGKSHCAVSYGILELAKGSYEKLVITRPMITAEEDPGALPGGVQDKLKEYLMPIYDELQYYISYSDIQLMINTNKIQIVPFAYMRGRTFKDAYVVGDEIQNASNNQLKMICTRLGTGSKLVLTGDIEQTDLPAHKAGAFKDHIEIIGEGQTRITTVELTEVIRSQAVSNYLEIMGYDKGAQVSPGT